MCVSFKENGHLEQGPDLDKLGALACMHAHAHTCACYFDRTSQIEIWKFYICILSLFQTQQETNSQTNNNFQCHSKVKKLYLLFYVTITQRDP